MNRPVHFEILADDLLRASKFYQTVFGWKIEKWGDENYLLIKTGEGIGIDGAIMPRIEIFSEKEEGYRASLLTIDVENFEEYAQKIIDAGGEQVNDRNDIPQVGSHAYFRDTEGNVFGIMQASK